MANEENNIGEELGELPEIPEGEEDTTDWKAEAQKNFGMAKRFRTQLEKLKKEPPQEAKPKEEPKPPEKKGFDYGEKAYLKSSGIEPEYFDLVKEVMESTGRPMDAVLELPYFKKDLESRREEKRTKEAVPEGAPRAGATPKDTTDYWVSRIQSGKSTLLDIPDFDLRVKVNNAMAKKGDAGSEFTTRPIY